VRVLAATVDFGESFWEEVGALVILIGLFYWKAWPALRKQMDRRAQIIASQLSAGEESRAAAEALVNQRRAALEAAKVEARTLVEQAGVSAARLAEDGERRAGEEYERLVARAATDIALERSRLMDEVVAELSGLVIAGATQVIEAELDARRQHRLIDEAITAAETEVA